MARGTTYNGMLYRRLHREREHPDVCAFYTHQGDDVRLDLSGVPNVRRVRVYVEWSDGT